MTVCGLVNLETGGNKMDIGHSLTTQQLITLNQILDSFSKNGQVYTTVTLESEESSHEKQVRVKLQRTADVIRITTSELTPVAKSYFDPISSVTSQRSLYGQKTPLNHYLTKLG